MTGQQFEKEVIQKIITLSRLRDILRDMILASETKPAEDDELLVILRRVGVLQEILITIANALDRAALLVPVSPITPEGQQALDDILNALREKKKKFNNGRQALAVAGNLLTAASILATEAKTRYDTATQPPPA